MEEKATCVLPKPGMTEEFNWRGSKRGLIWLGDDISPGYEVMNALGSLIVVPHYNKEAYSSLLQNRMRANLA